MAISIAIAVVIGCLCCTGSSGGLA